MPADRVRLRRVLWLLAFLTAVFVLVWRWPWHHPFEGAARYPPLHMLLETLSIVVAMLVFGVAWNAYSRERPRNVIILACALFAAGIIDFVHTLSFSGMPDFITPSGPEKAINFWLAARLTVALALLAVALLPWKPLARPWLRHVLLGGSLALTALVLWVGLYHQDAFPRTFVTGHGLTAFKLAAEYGIIAILAVPAAVFLRRSRQSVPYAAPSLFAATAISILSELSFTLYSDVTDIFNLLGHAYKVMAYVFIYHAVFVGSVREPFERLVRAEDVLRTSEERYRRVVEDDVAGVSVTTPDGRLLVCNPAFARILGYASVEEAMASNLVDHYPSPEARQAILSDLRARKRLDHREMTYRSRAGDPVHVIETVIGEFDERGELTAARTYLIDVTERRRLEDQLRQSQKMEAIGRLAGGIAHDFNNLLTAINGYAELLVAGLPPDDPRRGDALEIRSAGGRAATLTRQLLAFGRRQVLQTVVLDLNEVVAGLTPMLRRLIGEEIELRTAPGADLGHVRADPAQMEQVLLNLAVNARDAMPGGGMLTIETANVEFDEDFVSTHPVVTPGPYVLLAVSDTGIGMDAATLERIFEPFFTTKPDGTGLGLATVYGIVRQSGGHVWTYSEPGRGSTFKVYLPQVEEPVVPRSAGGIVAPAVRGTETILIVEDEEAVRGFAARVLGELGYTVVSASQPAEALRLVAERSGPIDLLVTDVILPGMNGRELAERLAALRPAMHMLFISGYAQGRVFGEGLLDASATFLAKPFTPDALARKVREVLQATLPAG